MFPFRKSSPSPSPSPSHKSKPIRPTIDPSSSSSSPSSSHPPSPLPSPLVDAANQLGIEINKILKSPSSQSINHLEKRNGRKKEKSSSPSTSPRLARSSSRVASRSPSPSHSPTSTPRRYNASSEDKNSTISSNNNKKNPIFRIQKSSESFPSSSPSSTSNSTSTVPVSISTRLIRGPTFHGFPLSSPLSPTTPLSPSSSPLPAPFHSFEVESSLCIDGKLLGTKRAIAETYDEAETFALKMIIGEVMEEEERQNNGHGNGREYDDLNESKGDITMNNDTDNEENEEDMDTHLGDTMERTAQMDVENENENVPKIQRNPPQPIHSTISAKKRMGNAKGNREENDDIENHDENYNHNNENDIHNDNNINNINNSVDVEEMEREEIPLPIELSKALANHTFVHSNDQQENDDPSSPSSSSSSHHPSTTITSLMDIASSPLDMDDIDNNEINDNSSLRPLTDSIILRKSTLSTSLPLSFSSSDVSPLSTSFVSVENGSGRLNVPTMINVKMMDQDGNNKGSENGNHNVDGMGNMEMVVEENDNHSKVSDNNDIKETGGVKVKEKEKAKALEEIKEKPKEEEIDFDDKPWLREESSASSSSPQSSNSDYISPFSSSFSASSSSPSTFPSSSPPSSSFHSPFDTFSPSSSPSSSLSPPSSVAGSSLSQRMEILKNKMANQHENGQGGNQNDGHLYQQQTTDEVKSQSHHDLYDTQLSTDSTLARTMAHPYSSSHSLPLSNHISHPNPHPTTIPITSAPFPYRSSSLPRRPLSARESSAFDLAVNRSRSQPRKKKVNMTREEKHKIRQKEQFEEQRKNTMVQNYLSQQNGSQQEHHPTQSYSRQEFPLSLSLTPAGPYLSKHSTRTKKQILSSPPPLLTASLPNVVTHYLDESEVMVPMVSNVETRGIILENPPLGASITKRIALMTAEEVMRKRGKDAIIMKKKKPKGERPWDADETVREVENIHREREERERIKNSNIPLAESSSSFPSSSPSRPPRSSSSSRISRISLSTTNPLIPNCPTPSLSPTVFFPNQESNHSFYLFRTTKEEFEKIKREKRGENHVEAKQHLSHDNHNPQEHHQDGHHEKEEKSNQMPRGRGRQRERRENYQHQASLPADSHSSLTFPPDGKPHANMNVSSSLSQIPPIVPFLYNPTRHANCDTPLMQKMITLVHQKQIKEKEEEIERLQTMVKEQQHQQYHPQQHQYQPYNVIQPSSLLMSSWLSSTAPITMNGNERHNTQNSNGMTSNSMEENIGNANVVKSYSELGVSTEDNENPNQNQLKNGIQREESATEQKVKNENENSSIIQSENLEMTPPSSFPPSSSSTHHSISIGTDDGPTLSSSSILIQPTHPLSLSSLSTSFTSPIKGLPIVIAKHITPPSSSSSLTSPFQRQKALAQRLAKSTTTTAFTSTAKAGDTILNTFMPTPMGNIKAENMNNSNTAVFNEQGAIATTSSLPIGTNDILIQNQTNQFDVHTISNENTHTPAASFSQTQPFPSSSSPSLSSIPPSSLSSTSYPLAVSSTNFQQSSSSSRLFPTPLPKSLRTYKTSAPLRLAHSSSTGFHVIPPIISSKDADFPTMSSFVTSGHIPLTYRDDESELKKEKMSLLRRKIKSSNYKERTVNRPTSYTLLHGYELGQPNGEGEGEVLKGDNYWGKVKEEEREAQERTKGSYAKLYQNPVKRIENIEKAREEEKQREMEEKEKYQRDEEIRKEKEKMERMEEKQRRKFQREREEQTLEREKSFLKTLSKMKKQNSTAVYKTGKPAGGPNPMANPWTGNTRSEERERELSTGRVRSQSQSRERKPKSSGSEHYYSSSSSPFASSSSSSSVSDHSLHSSSVTAPPVPIRSYRQKEEEPSPSLTAPLSSSYSPSESVTIEESSRDHHFSASPPLSSPRDQTISPSETKKEETEIPISTQSSSSQPSSSRSHSGFNVDDVEENFDLEENDDHDDDHQHQHDHHHDGTDKVEEEEENQTNILSSSSSPPNTSGDHQSIPIPTSHSKSDDDSIDHLLEDLMPSSRPPSHVSIGKALAQEHLNKQLGSRRESFTMGNVPTLPLHTIQSNATNGSGSGRGTLVSPVAIVNRSISNPNDSSVTDTRSLAAPTPSLPSSSSSSSSSSSPLSPPIPSTSVNSARRSSMSFILKISLSLQTDPIDNNLLSSPGWTNTATSSPPSLSLDASPSLPSTVTNGLSTKFSEGTQTMTEKEMREENDENEHIHMSSQSDHQSQSHSALFPPSPYENTEINRNTSPSASSIDAHSNPIPSPQSPPIDDEFGCESPIDHMEENGKRSMIPKPPMDIIKKEEIPEQTPSVPSSSSSSSLHLPAASSSLNDSYSKDDFYPETPSPTSASARRSLSQSHSQSQFHSSQNEISANAETVTSETTGTMERRYSSSAISMGDPSIVHEKEKEKDLPSSPLPSSSAAPIVGKFRPGFSVISSVARGGSTAMGNGRGGLRGGMVQVAPPPRKRRDYHGNEVEGEAASITTMPTLSSSSSSSSITSDINGKIEETSVE